MPLIDQQDIITIHRASSVMEAKTALTAALSKYPPCRIVSVSITGQGIQVSLIAVIETI
jgi:hypothetical protein